MTVGELAKECGVSEASVSRFCKRIELKGFHHLKISLARELVDAKDDGEISGHISVDDMEGSLRGILSNKMEELRQTVAMIDREELKKILEAAKSRECSGLRASCMRLRRRICRRSWIYHNHHHDKSHSRLDISAHLRIRGNIQHDRKKYTAHNYIFQPLSKHAHPPSVL